MMMFIEVTDTFNGESNYSWVRRYEQEINDGLSDLQIVRLAKKLAGWSGLKCNTSNCGYEFTLKPRGMCQVMFISFVV